MTCQWLVTINRRMTRTRLNDFVVGSFKIHYSSDERNISNRCKEQVVSDVGYLGLFAEA